MFDNYNLVAEQKWDALLYGRRSGPLAFARSLDMPRRIAQERVPRLVSDRAM